MWKQFLKIWRGEKPLIDVWHYWVGNYRYPLYYSKVWSFLLRKHIRQQIDFRIVKMNKTCYEQGSCIKCGCQTTHLQMCAKSCEGSCYPKMLDKREWNKYIKKNYFAVKNDIYMDTCPFKDITVISPSKFS